MLNNYDMKNTQLIEKFYPRLLTLIFIICICSTLYATDSPNFAITKISTHQLPHGTVRVLDFNTVVIVKLNTIKIVDISDSTNLRILYQTRIPFKKKFHSVQQKRYLILEDRTGNYFQTVTDMQTGRTTSLEELNGTSGAVSVAPNDGAILYNARFPLSSYVRGRREEKNIIKLKTFDGKSANIVENVHGTKWAPNGEWFLAALYKGREGPKKIWQRVLVNRKGQKIILPSDKSSIVGAIWTADGSALAVEHPWGGYVTVFEFKWNNKIPEVTSVHDSSLFSHRLLWSPNGQYLIYTKTYGDGHYDFGNDILVTNRTLTLHFPLIKHNNISETPIIWTHENKLVTQIDDMLYEYRIDIIK